MDGVTLCRRARQANLNGYLYILLLTSHGLTADIVAGLDAGADDYLKKPADEAELLARLKAGRRIINLERSLREAQTQLALLASTDPLLETYNRRHLMVELPRELERARRYGRALSVMVADLDHFKHVNDVYGHHIGDAVLVEFSRVARSCIRRSDWIARSGGEEFVIVLPETPLENALLTAEKVRVACESSPIQAGTAAIRLTASFGVAAMNPAEDPARAVTELLRQADTALYRSKHAGRNRVSAADVSPAPKRPAP
jgi:two-component system, cell cycle response regulator